MSEKKLKIVSLSIEDEMHDLLKSSSKKAGCSVSSLVRELVTKYLGLIVNDGDKIPVILEIPSHLKGDDENLKIWLTIRVDAIVKALCV
jgi:hypothetical protein